MSKFEDVFNWLKTCPYLINLWAISATVGDWQKVLFLNNTSALYNVETTTYTDGTKHVSMQPTTAYSEIYTINAYTPMAENADVFNIDAFNQTQLACDWIRQKQNEGDLFEIEGKPIYAVELLTPSPMMRGTDADNHLNVYYISIRIHMENPAKRDDYYEHNND